MKNKKKAFITLGLLVALMIITVGASFATWYAVREGTVENVIETSTVMLTYTEGKTGITLQEAYPMSDNTARNLIGDNNVFDFTVETFIGKSTMVAYEVAAIKLPITDSEALLDNEVRLYLEKAIEPDTNYLSAMEPSYFVPMESQSELGSPVGSMVIDKGMFTQYGKTVNHYRLRLWVAEETFIPDGISKKYGIKVNVYAKQITLEDTESSCFTVGSDPSVITGYRDNDTCPKDVVIPKIINGVAITGIDEGAFSNKNLTSVVIPEGVTYIGGYAFWENKLTNVIIPTSVTSIGDGAFANNNLPESQAFIYNRNSDGSIDYTSLNSYGGKKENLVLPDTITTIGSNALSSVNLKSVTLPSGLTSIGACAFCNNPLSSITIPSSVTKIDEGAFYNLPNLTTIVNQTNKAFYWSLLVSDSEDITSFVTGYADRRVMVTDDASHLIPVDESCFGFSNGTITGYNYETCPVNVVIPSTIKETAVTSIGYIGAEEGPFQSLGLINVVIPDTVTTIGGYAFLGNQLTSVTIPDSVTSIGEGAFVDNQLPIEQAFIYNRNSDGSINYSSLNSYGGKISSLILPSTITEIGVSAFYNVGLTDVTLPDNLITIGNVAFSSNQLKSITIPSSVTTIGISAFGSNRGLTKIVNKTGRNFDWGSVITGSSGNSFVTGTVGSVQITDN